ncbi:hypothetical protein K2Z83_26415 [Oscillochloris sp. ZM17-4]|uniref:hypothetical protein n=1 Tax=Oscillochloris sp. ZM17-4 TaxID=2866714 RepID=UPI001C739125|nr:hypothetical protein [Oscillochloris sp. ZM17-4]MBX0331188.1 hypothetical protein [Oscillochloris sp. ZM17-4]
MRSRSHLVRRLGLAALLLTLCALLALHTAAPARAESVPDPCTDDSSYLLCLGVMKKGDRLTSGSTLTYTVVVPSGQQIIVGAIDVGAIGLPGGEGHPPTVTVDCPTSASTQARVPASGRGVGGKSVFCTPVSTSGSATVTITLQGTSHAGVNYGVFAQRLNQASSTSFDGLNEGQGGTKPSLDHRKMKIFYIPNTDNMLKKRTLVFSPSSASRAAAALYRQDGNVRCGTFNREDDGRYKACEVFEDDYPDYYLVLMNAGDTPFNYGVKFNRP